MFKDPQKAKEYHKAYSRQHYLNNKESYRTRRKQSESVIREYIRQVKTGPCADCSITYPHYVMEFDHVRGEKRFVLARYKSKSLETVKTEIAKCDLVCSNCHAKRTFLRTHSSTG